MTINYRKGIKMNTGKSYTESFDYARMAQEAAREQEALHRRLELRRAAGPASPDQELVWKRENSILYSMYLEQRGNQRVFSRRARLREEALCR